MSVGKKDVKMSSGTDSGLRSQEKQGTVLCRCLGQSRQAAHSFPGWSCLPWWHQPPAPHGRGEAQRQCPLRREVARGSGAVWLAKGTLNMDFSHLSYPSRKLRACTCFVFCAPGAPWRCVERWGPCMEMGLHVVTVAAPQVHTCATFVHVCRPISCVCGHNSACGLCVHCWVHACVCSRVRQAAWIKVRTM